MFDDVNWNPQILNAYKDVIFNILIVIFYVFNNGITKEIILQHD